MVTNAFGVALSSDALLTVNLPPVADASATRAEFIAPIQCPPAIVLNGSLSSDPDGDSLNYLWFLNGSATPIATGAVAVVTLPSGLNSLLLSVDDGLATNSCMVEINVLTLPRALERLIDFVNSNVSNPRPLTATLSAALASLNHGATIPALNQLEAFLQKIAAQVSPTSPALAETLAQNAAQLIGILGRDCTKPQSPAKLAGFSKKPNGKLRLEFTAAAASLYIIEASTDLVEWVKIGVADNLTSGSVVADDLDSSKFPARFYRLVTPQAPPLPLRTDHN
jgi:hypothetical protein